MVSLIPVWTSGDVCPGLKSQNERLHILFSVWNGILRFTSSATPDLSVASMAAEPFQWKYLETSIGGARVQDLL